LRLDIDEIASAAKLAARNIKRVTAEFEPQDAPRLEEIGRVLSE
jgi:hypothetical protein